MKSTGESARSPGPGVLGTRVSRRTALKAAVAAGAVAYATPLVDTLSGAVAHAQNGVSLFVGQNVFVVTCKGSVTFADGSPGGATLTIKPNSPVCVGNKVTLTSQNIPDGTHTLLGTAVASVESGNTNVETVITLELDVCTIFIMNVVGNCARTPVGTQKISISCTGPFPYSTHGFVPITNGNVAQIALTNCV